MESCSFDNALSWKSKLISKCSGFCFNKNLRTSWVVLSKLCLIYAVALSINWKNIIYYFSFLWRWYIHVYVYIYIFCFFSTEDIYIGSWYFVVIHLLNLDAFFVPTDKIRISFESDFFSYSHESFSTVSSTACYFDLAHSTSRTAVLGRL